MRSYQARKQWRMIIQNDNLLKTWIFNRLWQFFNIFNVPRAPLVFNVVFSMVCSNIDEHFKNFMKGFCKGKCILATIAKVCKFWERESSQTGENKIFRDSNSPQATKQCGNWCPAHISQRVYENICKWTVKADEIFHNCRSFSVALRLLLEHSWRRRLSDEGMCPYDAFSL